MLTPQKKPAPLLSIEDFTGAVETNKGALRMQKLIASSKINLSEKLSPPPIAMHIKGKLNPIALFTKGNFSIVTGKAKSRKSFLISMFLAAAAKGSFQEILFCDQQGVNILFDTEQSRYKVQQISRRICNLSENTEPSNLEFYSLRTLEPLERLELIDSVLANTPNVNFVAIDGIIDLGIDPIMQSEQALQIIMKLMQWTEIYNIHITCVLHYNKTVATLLGHLGSFSHRKADAVIEVSKCNDDDSISIVRPLDCRERDFTSFAFSVDEDGMPYILKDYVPEKKTKADKEPKSKKPVFIFSELDDEVHREILTLVFKNKKEQSYDDCWRNIKNSTQLIASKTIADNKAKEYLTYYQSTGEIVRIEQPKKKAVYVLPGQKNIDF